MKNTFVCGGGGGGGKTFFHFQFPSFQLTRSIISLSWLVAFLLLRISLLPFSNPEKHIFPCLITRTKSSSSYTRMHDMCKRRMCADAISRTYIREIRLCACLLKQILSDILRSGGGGSNTLGNQDPLSPFFFPLLPRSLPAVIAIPRITNRPLSLPPSSSLLEEEDEEEECCHTPTPSPTFFSFSAHRRCFLAFLVSSSSFSPCVARSR